MSYLFQKKWPVKMKRVAREILRITGQISKIKDWTLLMSFGEETGEEGKIEHLSWKRANDKIFWI